jgi:hypothetical protein
MSDTPHGRTARHKALPKAADIRNIPRCTFSRNTNAARTACSHEKPGVIPNVKPSIIEMKIMTGETPPRRIVGSLRIGFGMGRNILLPFLSIYFTNSFS